MRVIFFLSFGCWGTLLISLLIFWFLSLFGRFGGDAAAAAARFFGVLEAGAIGKGTRPKNYKSTVARGRRRRIFSRIANVGR